MKRALVFSGGGAKGSYQIGVWKALRKLHIKIDIVTGCSIGSINAALFAENKYHIAKKMWLKITTDDLFTKDETKVFKTLGLKFDKAKEYLDRLIDESKIRKSKIDYGLVTFNYKKRTPKILTKQEIPEGKLVDYILASSTFYPFIEKKKIDDNYETLKLNLSLIDAELKSVANNANNKTIVVSDDVFKYLEKYGFTVISLEENENLTDKVISDVRKLISNKSINYIFIKDNEEENNTIKTLKNTYNIQTISLNSLATLSASDRKDKKDYISIMMDNINSIKLEVNK